uniref:DUF1289 domain-containing protein n=1 Tax=Ascaris lumbricoides TaxID=6252 RepID=A0A0M3HT30_ASCLU
MGSSCYVGWVAKKCMHYCVGCIIQGPFMEQFGTVGAAVNTQIAPPIRRTRFADRLTLTTDSNDCVLKAWRWIKADV